MTATIKKFCRLNGIDEASADLADMIYNALTGGDADGHLEGHCAGGEEVQASIPDGAAGTADSGMRFHD